MSEGFSPLLLFKERVMEKRWFACGVVGSKEEIFVQAEDEQAAKLMADIEVVKQVFAGTRNHLVKTICAREVDEEYVRKNS